MKSSIDYIQFNPIHLQCNNSNAMRCVSLESCRKIHACICCDMCVSSSCHIHYCDNYRMYYIIQLLCLLYVGSSVDNTNLEGTNYFAGFFIRLLLPLFHCSFFASPYLFHFLSSHRRIHLSIFPFISFTVSQLTKTLQYHINVMTTHPPFQASFHSSASCSSN